MTFWHVKTTSFTRCFQQGNCTTQPETQSHPAVQVAESDTMPGDILAFGVILHELLTQERPFLGPLRAIR